MSRTTLIYLGIFVVLLVADIARELTPAGPTPISFSIPAVAAEGVTRIKLYSKEGEVLLEKDGAGWKVGAPINYPADKAQVEGLLKTFEKAITMDFKVGEDPALQAQYELTEEQALKVEIFKGEVAEVALLVGKNGPMGTNFVRPVGSPEIFRAKVGARSRFEKKPGDWRDKRVMAVEQADITSLVVVEATQKLSFTKTGDLWQSVEPAGLDLDQASIDGMARSFANLRAQEILEGEAPGGSGVENPSLMVTATLKDGSTREIRAGFKKDDTTVYVGRSTDDRRFEVSASSLDSFRKKPEELRNKSLLSFQAEDLARLSIVKGERRVVIETGATPGEWQVVEPKGGAVDSQSMMTLALTLGSLRAQDFAPSDITATAAGLDKDTIDIEVILKAGNTLKMQLGGGAGDALRYARAEGGPIMTLRTQTVASIAKLVGG